MKHSSAFALPLALLREEIAASDLLPERYARYRPLLADGICFFLERLSPARLNRIFLEQGRLPASTSLPERVVTLLHHLPTLHKVGQVVARDRRLDPAFRKHLQQLETLRPRTQLSAVVRLLEREFPGWRKAGIRLGPQPLAEGSVAVVMPFTWRTGRKRNPKRGVFKLLKSGIERRLDEDLAIWSKLGDFLDTDCQRYHLPALDYKSTFDTVRDLLMTEVQLDLEQKHLSQAAADYAAMPGVVIPGLFPFCTPRLTAMEQIEGEPLTARLARNNDPLRKFAPLIVRALVACPIFSSHPAPIFHADPHAGNLFVTSDERLGILDWSLVGRLEKAVRGELVQLLIGALAQDAKSMTASLATLSRNNLSATAMPQIINQSLRELRRGAFPGLAWLTRLLDQVVMRGGMRLRPDLLLFRKLLLTLEGVLADITGDDSAAAEILDSVVLSAFLRNFLQEWPERWRQPLHSRTFTTQLSNRDLWSLYWSSPAILARYWIGALGDVITPITNC